MSLPNRHAQSVLAVLKDRERIDVDRADPASHEFPSAKVAARLGLTVTVGRIGSIGRYSDGSGSVEFYVSGGSGYGSAWPEWAFDLARDALLHGKQVRVIARGDPYGENLVQVDLRPGHGAAH
jgi:hypothetical protein